MRYTKVRTSHPIVLSLALAGLMISTTLFTGLAEQAFAQSAGPSWSYTGSLNTARSGYTATLLRNGKVLVAGDSNAAGALASADLYDPSTGTWSVTGNLNFPRTGHSATLLQNGKVLVAGGYANGCCQESALTDTAELYDPATGGGRPTGNLKIIPTGHTATMLPNGKGLFAGGGRGGAFSATQTAELYEPATGTWRVPGNPNQ